MMTATFNQRSPIFSISRYQTQHRHSNGWMKNNLKISNLPSHYTDIAIISSFKQLLDPISTITDFEFKKIVFKRTLNGKAFLFVKFANQNHINAAYSAIYNKSIGGHQISVQLTSDDDVPKATKALSTKRGNTLYRGGFIIQHLQNGRERMTTIIPNSAVFKTQNEDQTQDRAHIPQHHTRRHRMGGKIPFAMQTDIKVEPMLIDDDDDDDNDAKPLITNHKKEGNTMKSRIKSKPKIKQTKNKIKCIAAVSSLIETTERKQRNLIKPARKNPKIRRFNHIRSKLELKKTFKTKQLKQVPKKSVSQNIQMQKLEQKKIKNRRKKGKCVEILDLKSKLKKRQSIINKLEIKIAEQKETEANDSEADIICMSPIAAHFNAPNSSTTFSFDRDIVDYSKQKVKKDIILNTKAKKKVNKHKTHPKIFQRAVDLASAPASASATAPKKNKTKLKCRLFIENINPNIGDNQLKTKFEKYGSVSSAKIIRDPATNASKGLGFVTFKSAKASKRAISSMNNASWFGQKLRVSYVSDKSGTQKVTNANRTPSITNLRAVIRKDRPKDPRHIKLQPCKQTQIKARPLMPSRVPPPPRPPPPPPPPALPPPASISAAVAKAPIVHDFTPKQMMQTVTKRAESSANGKVGIKIHFSAGKHAEQTGSTANGTKRASMSPPVQNSYLTKTNNSISSTKPNENAYLRPHIQPVHPAQYYSYNRFMPLVIPGNINQAAVPQPPIISGSLSQIKKKDISNILTQMQMSPNNVVKNGSAEKLEDIQWNHAVLLGKLPDKLPNEYHKLRFHIEQNAGVPVTSIHILQKPIPSISNTNDVFTCCTLFDSEPEAKNAFENLQKCKIMNQSIICCLAKQYISQINAASGIKQATSTESTNSTAEKSVESNIKLKSMSISRTPSPAPQKRAFSPPSKSNSPSAISTKKQPLSTKDCKMRKERDSDRDESHRAEDRRRRDRAERDRRRPRHRLYSEDEDDVHYRRRSRSRSRERYYHRERYRDRYRSRERRYYRDRDHDHRRHSRQHIKFSTFDSRSRRRSSRYSHRSRSHSFSRDRSWSNSSSRSRSKSYHKPVANVTSRCVILCCTANQNADDVKETEITNFFDGSIVRIIKRSNAIHEIVESTECDLYFYIKFENVSSVKKCYEKLNKVDQFRCYSLIVQSMDENIFDLHFAPDAS